MRQDIRKKRALKIRTKMKRVNYDRYRLSVFRSSKNISAQIIDDKNKKTLISASTIEKKLFGEKKMKKNEFSVLLGEILAKRAKEKKLAMYILTVVVTNTMEESKLLLNL